MLTFGRQSTPLGACLYYWRSDRRSTALYNRVTQQDQRFRRLSCVETFLGNALSGELLAGSCIQPVWPGSPLKFTLIPLFKLCGSLKLSNVYSRGSDSRAG